MSGSSRPASAIVQLLAEAVSAGDAARGVLATLGRELGWDVGLLWMSDDEGRLLRAHASWSVEDPVVLEFRRLAERLTFAPGVGLPGRVWEQRSAVWLEEVAEDHDFPRARPAAAAGVHSAVAVPLADTGDVLGVIELLSRTPRPPEREELGAVTTAAAQLAHYLGRLRAEDRLRQSEERWSAIFEAALDCVVIMDHRGLVVDLNPAAVETFGYRRDEALGTLLAGLIVPPELRAAHLAGLERYLETGQPTILNRRLQLTAQRASGEVFPVELTVTRIGRQEPPVFAGFLRDITDRHEAEAERRRLLREALTSRAAEEAARVHTEQARAAAEADRARMEFLARAGLRMAGSMDYQTTLEAVARTAVPDIADWCTVTVIDDRGRPELVASAHVDARHRRLAEELVRRHPPDGLAGLGAAEVIRTGQPTLLSDVDGEFLAGSGLDPEHAELLAQLGVRSSLTVPVQAYGRRLGTITLVVTGLDRRLAEGDLTMARALAARAGLHIENARLYTARSRIAHTLQQSLLPARLPEIPGVEIAVRHQAAGDQNDVGGDFYDVFPSGPGAWTAIVGDVSGKGVRAAALTALARHSLFASALREDSPAANLAFLNEAMLRRTDDAASFCTVAHARVCPGPDAVAVTVSCGGHPPPLVLRAGGQVEVVDVRGTLVGALPDPVFEERELRLLPGDLMLLYTDGAIELRREDLAFGQRELEAVLREQAGRSAEAVVDAALRRVAELQGEGARDDVALLAVRAAAASQPGY